MRGDVVLLSLALATAAAHADPAETCARVGNDDTVRPYDPELRQGFLHAFRTLYPDAKGGQSDKMMRAGAAYRCMGGKLYACFTGANLPCAKIVASNDNPAVARFCGEVKATDVVPLYVVGHDSQYSYKCTGGRAVVTGETWALDARGFAVKLWAPMEE